jgi:hypothetical protein
VSQKRTRSVSVTLWLTSEEREQLTVNAQWWGETIQDFLRAAALGETRDKPRGRDAAKRRKEMTA